MRAVLLYPKIKKTPRAKPKGDRGVPEQSFSGLVSWLQGRIDSDVMREDPADNKYLSAALEAKADFIISGDPHLKNLKVFEGIRILDPSAFLAL